MSSQGSVIGRVYTSDAYLPLYDVPVIFFQSTPDGSNTLLAIRRTDASGLTAPLYIETPDTEQSLLPGSPIRPYTTINISVSVPGYRALTAEGVQIFPGIQTIQDLQLLPVSPLEHGTSATVQEQPQNL